MTMYSWMIGALIVGLLFLVLLLYWLWRRKGVASGGAPAVPRVRGVAVDRFGKLLPGLVVQVFDRDIGDRRISLGSTTTDAKGAFEIKFSAPGSPSGGAGSRRASADLVFALAVEGQPIADFDIIRIPVDGDTLVSAEYVVSPEELALGLVARIDEWIRIVANGFALPAGVAKYDRLVAALAPLTKRTPLESFDEAKSRDISFAARAIGAPFAEVNDMVTAHKLVHGDLQEVDAAAVFALVDQWGANEPRHLAQRSITEISAALRHAAEASTIAALEDPIATATLIQRAAIRAALSPTGSGSAASLDSILVDVLPEAEARETLLSAAINHAGTADEFWREYEENHPSAPVAELKYTFQLGVLTNNNARLVNALKRAAPTATSLRGLALAVDSARIEELLQGEEELSSGEAHIVAGQVAGLLEAAHPTAAVARSAMRWSRQDPDAVGKAAAVLLNKAVVETDFDIMRDDIGDYLQSERGRRFAETSSTEAQSDAVEGIRRIVRLFNVSTDPLILDHLALKRMNGGVLLRGGMDIAQYGKPAFLLNFPEASDAERHMLSYLHDRARAMTDTVATLLIGQHQDNNDVAPLAAVGKLGGVASTEEARASDGGTPIASWSDLFGGAEMCDCDDCRSVVGPAAYLVDLFEFLDKRCAANPTTWATPLDVLIGHPGKPAMRGATPGIRGKRPDLAHIKLTCENTNTTIPTIDLINEILETLVACDTDAPALPFESSPGITGPELSAGPEHVLPAAYEKVGGAVYPISLPYDRLVATARAYLQQAGTSRAEIIRLFSEASATKSKAAGHAETLGLFRRDYEILTGFTFGGAAVTPQISVASLYGFPGPSSGWSAEISVSRRLLQALQITFEELVTLLRTRYVGGEVPTGQPAELASRIFLTVDQLKALRAANFVVVPGSEIEDALALGGLTPTELSEYVEERLPRLSSTIVLNPPIGCSPDDITLRYLDGGYLDSDEIWLKLHRFVRLARRMKATFAELDAALFAVAGDVAPVFTRPLLGDLASLGDLRKRLALSWPVAASLVADIDTYGSASLYDELFIASGLARVSPVFRKGVGGVFEDDLDIEQGLSALAAAFNADLDDLVSIARDLGLTKLTLGTVSAVHRVLTLARTLSIEPREFLAMAGAIEAPDLADPSALSPDAVAGLVIRVQTLRSSGLTSSTIKFVKGESSEVGHTDPELDEILAALDETLKPLWERDDREAGDAAQTPDVDHVTEGEQRRRAAALPVLIKAFGVDDRIGRRLLDDQVDDGVARAALLRYQAGPAIALLAGRRQTPEERAAAARLLRGLDRIASLAKSMAIDAATFELTVTAGMLSKRVVDDLLDRPASGIVAAMLDEFADLVNLRNEVKRTDKLVTAVTAIATGGLSDAATAAVGALLGASEEAVRAVPIGKVKELDEPVVRRRPGARALA